MLDWNAPACLAGGTKIPAPPGAAGTTPLLPRSTPLPVVLWPSGKAGAKLAADQGLKPLHVL